MSIKQLQSPRQINASESSSGSGVKIATNWLFFWLVAGITAAKDLADPILSAVEGAFAATGAGIPISILIMFLGALMTLTVGIITMTYFIYTKKSFFTRMIITSIGALMGIIPIVNIPPETTIAFFAGFFVEKISAASKKVLSAVASTVLNRRL